jgi:hypothetical protein
MLDPILSWANHKGYTTLHYVVTLKVATKTFYTRLGSFTNSIKDSQQHNTNLKLWVELVRLRHQGTQE